MAGSAGGPASARARAAVRVLLAALLVLSLPALRPGAAESPPAAAPEAPPAARAYVSDSAGVMGAWAAKTEALCREIERRTTAEVAVLTVRTTGALPAQQYAQEVFDRWKIGKKGKDNGVLVLLAVDDRKVWIATGYGVEGVLPDGKVGAIRDGVMLPAFRRKEYGEGIYLGVAAIGGVLGAGTAAPAERKKRYGGVPVPFLLFAAAVGILLLRSLFSGPFGSYRRGGGGWYPGGFGGGGFGGGGFGGGGFGGFGGGSSGGGGAGGGW